MARNRNEGPFNIAPPGGSMREIRDAARKLRDAEGDEAKGAAMTELATLLDNYFEDDIKRRAEELARIEERVKKLHALLEKRKSKKQEIIDLQIKVLENEAEGLGFFSGGQPPMGGPDPLAVLVAPPPPQTAPPALPRTPGFAPPAGDEGFYRGPVPAPPRQPADHPREGSPIPD